MCENSWIEENGVKNKQKTLGTCTLYNSKYTKKKKSSISVVSLLAMTNTYS